MKIVCSAVEDPIAREHLSTACRTMQQSQFVMRMHDQENNITNGALGKSQDAHGVQQRRYVRWMVVVECGHWWCDVGRSMVLYSTFCYVMVSLVVMEYCTVVF